MQAGTVVNAENASLSSMGTPQLLDLFQHDKAKKKAGAHRAT